MLAEKMQAHKADAWLINTGWNGGKYGVGKRISLKYSRAIIDGKLQNNLAIHSGALKNVAYENYPVFNLSIPTSCPGVPSEVLDPKKSWLGDSKSFEIALGKLAGLFRNHFKTYEDKATPDILAAAPVV